MSDKYLILLLLNICWPVLAYLFNGWIKEAWSFVWSDLDSKTKYCDDHKPFGLWRAFNRVMVTLAIYKWAAMCLVMDIYVVYSLMNNSNPFG